MSPICLMTDKPGADTPKRILALSGGGARGIVEVAFLEAIERSYQARFGADKRSCVAEVDLDALLR